MDTDLRQEFDQVMESGDEQDWLYRFYAGEADKIEDYRQLRSLAKSYYRHYNLDYGLIIYLHLDQVKPAYKTKYAIAKGYVYLQDYHRAIEWLHKIPESKRSKRMHLLEGEILLNLGYVNETISIYKCLVAEHPTDSRAYFALAELFMNLHAYSEARVYLEALQEYFLDIEVQRQVRVLLIDLEMQEEIIDTQKISAMIENPSLKIQDIKEAESFAKFYFFIKDYDQALKYVQDGLGMNHAYLPLRRLLADIYLRQGKRELLIKELSWLIDNLSLADTYIIDLAKICQEIKWLPEALIIHLELYMDQIEDVEEAYLAVGLIVTYYLNHDQAKEGLHFLKTNYFSQILGSHFYYDYARVFEALEIYDRAEEYYQLALVEYEPNDHLLYDYARFLYQGSRCKEAIQVLEKYSLSFYNIPKAQDFYKRISLEYKRIKSGDSHEFKK